MSVWRDLTQRNIFRQGHSDTLSPRRQNREQNMTDTAKITLGDTTVDSPVLSGTVGPDVVDIRKFYAQTGASCNCGKARANAAASRWNGRFGDSSDSKSVVIVKVRAT